MELQIEILSREVVKPAIPTDPHFKYYKLSLLDQSSQFTFVPHILFYKPGLDNHATYQIDTIHRLKWSLSKAISLYYPLAGRLTADESSIECNDRGVSFVVARAHDCSIVNFLEAPNRVDLVGRFLSKSTTTTTDTSSSSSNTSNNNHKNSDTGHVSRLLIVTELVPMITIQVTFFDCGGLVIGSQWLHKVCDAASWGHFIKTWACFSAGRNDSAGRNKDVVLPDFTAAISGFPPRNPSVQPQRKARTLVPLSDDEVAQETEGVCMVKAFTFSPDAISAIQANGSSSDVPNPTRIEAVSGFIWKHAMSAAAVARASSSASSGSSVLGLSAVTHALNMRHRIPKPLPSATFGNVLLDIVAKYDPGQNSGGETGPELQDLICRIQKSLSIAKDAKILGKFIGQAGADLLCKYKHKVADILGDNNVTTYKFTSWIGLDLNPDFGFGIPIWAGFTGGKLSPSFKNLIILMETTNGGIEAWVILDEQEMLILQEDPDFIEFALPSTIG